MRILIEALGIHNYGGGRTATLNLLQNLLAIDPHNRYRVLLTRPEPGLLARNLQQIILPVENRFLARILAQVSLPIISRGCNGIHFAKNLGLMTRKPSLVTLYDLTTLLHPELVPRIDAWYWRRIQPLTLKKARRVIAISRATAQDAQTHFGLDPAKISVIYPSVGARFQPATPEQIAEIRQHYSLPREYVLHVGRMDRKNNIGALIHAFAQSRYRGALVIVGQEYAKTPARGLGEMIETLELTGRVHFTGALPDEALPMLYSGAQAVVMPSLHEGFGLVAAEAMACGAALIAGRVGALPEVTAGAAMLVDEPNAIQITEALDELLDNPARLAALQQAAIEVGAHYRNVNDARQTLALYEQIAA